MMLETRQGIRERHWEAGELELQGSMICIHEMYSFKKLTLNMGFHSMHTFFVTRNDEGQWVRFMWVKMSCAIITY